MTEAPTKWKSGEEGRIEEFRRAWVNPAHYDHHISLTQLGERKAYQSVRPPPSPRALPRWELSLCVPAAADAKLDGSVEGIISNMCGGWCKM